MERNSGFTYIEIIIVVLIVSILSVAGVSSYTQYNARKQTEAVTRKVAEYVQLAQEKTRANDIPDGCSTYDGYYYVDLTGTSMSLVPSGCTTVATYNTTVFNFSEGDFQVIFDPLGTAASGDSCILVEHPTAGLCGKISIETSGIVTQDLLLEANCLCP